MNYLREFFSIIKESFKEWNNDNAPMLAAALAYYTAFSVAPLLVITIAILGVVFNQADVQAQILDQIESAVGAGAASIVGDIIENMTEPGRGLVSSLISVVGLLFGALALFNNLQIALNRIWGVDDAEPENGFLRFIMNKLLSFGMILIVGFLLMVSLIASTALTFFDSYLFSIFPNSAWLLRISSELLFVAITTVLFMMLFKFLPYAEIHWRDVWVGALVTAILFTVGRTVLSMYLANSAVSSTYGAAGAFALILLWVYYSAQIVLFGAEFTQVYARRYGKTITTNASLNVFR